MSGSHPLPDEWMEGLVTLIPKAADATTMKKYRPITNISTGYKLCATEVADRMARTMEEYGAWHDSQEEGDEDGAPSGKSTSCCKCWSRGNASARLRLSCNWTSTLPSRQLI